MKPGWMIAHYRCVEKIGEGGMGVVWKALDTRLDRHVALKVLRPELTSDPERRRQFLREARSAAAVSHPNIATIHEIGEADSMTFIVMELVEGRTLGALVREGPVPLDEALRIACEIIEGMARAHEARVIHRDLKPDNVVIDREGRVRILDFGLARILDEPDPAAATDDSQLTTRDVSEEGKIMGTAMYMSPEQVRGDDVDARSDIFSFGITLYEMLTGVRPFAGKNSTSTLARILEAAPEPPGRLVANLPEAVEDAVLRCLKKKPADRYATSRDLLRDLRRLQQDPGVTSRALPDSSLIAVFPFAVRGGAEFAYLGVGLVDLLATKLDGAGDLRSVDTNVILCCGEPEPQGRALDPDLGRQGALKFGAGLFVLGSVLEVAGRLHIDASLYDTRRGEPIARTSVQGLAVELLEMVDRLAADLLASHSGGPTARLTQIAATSTRSLPALKSYLEGEREMRAMRRGPAVEAFEAAVRRDESFALAWYRLAVAALWSLQPEKAWVAAEHAHRHSDRLTERDRRLLDAFLAVLRGHNDDAERLYRGIVGLYPDEMDAWYNLGEMLIHHGPQRGRSIAESRGAWERLVALDPRHVSALVHLGVIAAIRKEFDELNDLCARVETLSPVSDSSLWMRAVQVFAAGDAAGKADVIARVRGAGDHTVTYVVTFVGPYLGDLDGAQAIAETLIDPVRSAPARALGHVYIAHLEMSRGRPEAAMRALREAGRSDAATGLLYRGLLAAHPLLVTSRETMEAALQDLRSWAPSDPIPADDLPLWLEPHRSLYAPLRLYLMGLLDARLGRPEEASRAAVALGSFAVPVGTGSLVSEMAFSVKAAAAEARGDRASALEALRRIRGETCFYMTLWSPFFSQALERFRLAELNRFDNRDGYDGCEKEAMLWYRSFEHVSIFDIIHLGPSLLRLAEIHKRLGESEDAAQCCERLLRLWEGCEPSLAGHVASARSMLRELRRGA